MVVGLSIVCALLQFVFYRQVGDDMKLKSGYLLLAIFAFLVTLFHLILIRSAEGSAQSFIRSFMGVTAAKLLIYLSVLMLFLAFSNENKKAVAIHFLFYYAVFTVFEINQLMNDLKKIK